MKQIISLFVSQYKLICMTRRAALEEEITTLRVKMNLVHERQEIDKANRYAPNEMEQRKLELQNEERRLLKEIKISKEKFKIKE